MKKTTKRTRCADQHHARLITKRLGRHTRNRRLKATAALSRAAQEAKRLVAEQLNGDTQTP